MNTALVPPNHRRMPRYPLASCRACRRLIYIRSSGIHMYREERYDVTVECARWLHSRGYLQLVPEVAPRRQSPHVDCDQPHECDFRFSMIGG